MNAKVCKGTLLSGLRITATTGTGPSEYRVKLLNHTTQTWEPVAHLPHSAITGYCKRRGLPLPGIIGQDRVGGLTLACIGRY